MIQRYGDPEHVIFHESRVGTAIRLGIKEQFTDTGAELIRIADIPEKSRDGRVLGLRFKIFGRDNPLGDCPVRIFDQHATAFDDKFRLERARKLAMHQRIRNHLANDDVTEAFAECIFDKELVGQMLLGERKKTVVAFDKVRIDDIAVVVAVHIFAAQQRISSIGRTNAMDYLVAPQ